MTLATEPDELNPELPGTPEPDARIINPSSGKIESIYRNIVDEPLLGEIKGLEERLKELDNDYTVEKDVERVAEGLGDAQAGPDGVDTKYSGYGREEALRGLLDCFNRLLKTPYGAIGYLVGTDSESIVKLYGVDTDMDFYAMVHGSRIRISSRRLERAVAVSGRRWIGERGLILHNPAETPLNERLAEDAINEIIAAIQSKLRSA